MKKPEKYVKTHVLIKGHLLSNTGPSKVDTGIQLPCEFCSLFRSSGNMPPADMLLDSSSSHTNTVDDNMPARHRLVPVTDVHPRIQSFPKCFKGTGMLRSSSGTHVYRNAVLILSSLLMLIIALSVQIQLTSAHYNAEDDLLLHDDTPVAARLTTTAGNSFSNDTGSGGSWYGDNGAALVADSIPMSNYLSDITARSRADYLDRNRRPPPRRPSRLARFSPPSTSPTPTTVIPETFPTTVTDSSTTTTQDAGIRNSFPSRFMTPETKKSRGARWWKIGLSKRPEDFSNLTALLISADGLKSSGGFYYNYAVRKMVAENEHKLQVLPHQYDPTSNNNDPDTLNMIADSDPQRSAAMYRKDYKDNAQTASYRAAMLAPLFLQANSKLFNRKQRHLLKHFRGSIFSVAEAAEMAINECQYQFRGRQWNCPIDRNGMTVFGNVLDIARGCKQGTIDKCSCSDSSRSSHRGRRLAGFGRRRQYREISAEEEEQEPHQPALLSTARGGTLTSLSHNNNNANNVAVEYVWSGCSDNVWHGDEFARRFTTAAERGTRDARSLMNKHNNKAGNWHVGNMMERRCKCHGMSGSCTVQTCWWQLPPFRAIADQLKDRFDGASRVMVGNRVFARREVRRILPPPLSSTGPQNDFIRRKMNSGGGGGSGQPTIDDENRQRYATAASSSPNTLSYLQPYDPQFKPPTAADLVYLEASPEFCEPNLRLNIPGTHGRPCNETSQGMDGCDLMCCHRGYRTVIRVEHEKCRCKFKWCCKVECEVCRVEYRDVFCN